MLGDRAGHGWKRSHLRGNALKNQVVTGGGEFLDGHIIKPDPAGMVAEQTVQGQRFDRLVGEDDQLAPLPIVGAAAELGGLTPKRGAVLVAQVHIEGVIAVGRAADLFGLAPAAHDQRRGVGAIQNERLRHAIPALAGGILAEQGGAVIAARGFREAITLGARVPISQSIGLPGLALFEARIAQEVGAGLGRGEDAQGGKGEGGGWGLGGGLRRRGEVE